MRGKAPHLKQLASLSALQRLESIKHDLFTTLNSKNKSRSIEAAYRSKANKLYKDKLKHVFHPLKMEERPDILNFQNYLDEYVEQTNQLKLVVQNDEPYTNETIQKMTRSDVFDVLLTLDVGQLCEISPKIPTKPQYSTLTEIEEKNQSEQNLPKLINKNHSYKSRYTQSPINISCSSGNRLQSPKSPLKRSRNSNSIEKSTGSSKISIKKYRRSQPQIQPQFTPHNLIDRLNQINNSVQDQATFSMKRSTFKHFLTSKHTTQVITSYFDLPETLLIAKIAEMLNTIYQSTLKQKLMIAFLTFDINKDGFICEQDLFQISKTIDHNSCLNSDIQKITQFCKIKAYKPPTESQLPEEFYKNPKRNAYLTLFEKNSYKKSTKNLKLPEINDNKVHYFTIGKPESEREQFTYSTIKDGRKNVIRVNFKMFQEIFMNQECEFIGDFLCFFTKDEEKQADEQLFLKLKRKMSHKSVRFQSQSLPLRNSNRSIQAIRQKFAQAVSTSENRMNNIRNLRSNTEGIVLENILLKKSKDKQKNEKTLILDKIQRKSSTDNKFSNRYEDKCSICHKYIAKKVKNQQNQRYTLSKDLIEKLSVFRADRSNLQFAHGVLKCQHFSYSPAS